MATVLAAHTDVTIFSRSAWSTVDARLARQAILPRNAGRAVDAVFPMDARHAVEAILSIFTRHPSRAILARSAWSACSPIQRNPKLLPSTYGKGSGPCTRLCAKVSRLWTCVPGA